MPTEQAIANLRSLTSHAACAANLGEVFENQMNNEHEMSRISLHDFSDIEGHILRGVLNIKDEDNEPKRH